MASATTKEEKERKSNVKKSHVTKPSLNMDELRELADLIDERGFTDFEFENEKIRVRLSKNIIPAPILQSPQSVTQPMQVQSTSSNVAQAESSLESGESVTTDDGLYKITSPIVGTYYSSPAPDKPSYVKEGDKVSEDTIVCIVEAMKLMNEIQAEVSGEIVKVYVENAQPVEYGQPLFGIKQ